MPMLTVPRKFRRRRTRRRRPTASVKAVKKIAQKVVNSSKETKRHIVETGDETNCSILGQIGFPLNDVSQGDTTFTRDGDVLYAMRFQGGYILTNRNSFPIYMRVMIVSDKTQAFSLTTSELFEGVNDTDMTISDARSAGFHVPLFAKINTQKCYSIYDKIHKIDPVQVTTVLHRYNVKLNRKFVYDGAEVTPSKHIHDFRLIFICVDATNDEVSGNTEVSGQCHFFYKDI